MGKNLWAFFGLVLIGYFVVACSVRAQSQDSGDVEDKFRSTVGSWIEFFEGNISWLSQAMIGFLKNVIKATYFLLGLAGFVMWSTGFSKYSGKRLIAGAVMMALVSEILL